MLESLPVSRPRPLNEMFPSATQEALDLLRICVQFNPTKRCSAKDAVRHPYVVQFHNPEDEFDCDRTIRIPIDDNTKLTVQDYRERLYNEVLKKKKEQRRSHRRNLELQQQQQQQQDASQQQHSSAHYSQHSAPQAHYHSSQHASSTAASQGVCRSSHSSTPSSGTPSHTAPSQGVAHQAQYYSKANAGHAQHGQYYQRG